MSLLVASLNSGSNGNCYYVGNGDEAVLVDCGIHCREIETRMKRLGLSIRKIKGIFITHEHGDHISGVRSISKKYKIPVFVTEKTLNQSGIKLLPDLCRFIAPTDAVSLGDLLIESFPKSHDAVEPVSFLVRSRSVTVGVFTDLGHSCDTVIEKFRQCHAVFLEANYDERMLETGPYPYYLQERIRGKQGHLSNEQAFQLVRDHRAEFMSHVILAHLSRHNNSPKVVANVFQTVTAHAEVIIATRKKETPLYHIRGSAAIKKMPSLPAEQLALF